MSAPAAPAATTAAAYEFAAFLGDRDTVEVFRQFVGRQLVGAAHVQRGGVRQAVSFVEKQDRSPKFIVVDVSGADMPLPEIDALADACEPGVTVVVVGDQQDVGLFRQLLGLGVADYLVKPITAELLAQTLGGDLKPAGVRGGLRTGKLVAFAGTRGGVGTTTLATSLAWLVANRMNRRVAFVDLDPHGGGGPMLLDVEVGGLGEAVAHAENLDALFLDRTMVKHGQRLHCLSAEEDLTKEVALEVEALERLFTALEQQFHYVVVDLPRRAGPALRFTLQRAAIQVVLADRTLPSLHNTVRLLPLLEGLGRRTVLVLNEHQPLKASALDRETVESSIGRSFDLVVPFDKSAPERGDNLGEPLADGRQPFAAAVRELAADFSGQRVNRKRGWRAKLGLG
ncbi:MAG: AAA family ATPase [Alphaproteobacteria bacterium]|jgi:pilus assembly protein CpaE|nr:AAA family ATPase [Alphaproteobacteria bacterium]